MVVRFFCNDEECYKARLFQETELDENGYKTTMTYTKTITANNGNRARNVTWFNPPYSQNG